MNKKKSVNLGFISCRSGFADFRASFLHAGWTALFFTDLSAALLHSDYFSRALVWLARRTGAALLASLSSCRTSLCTGSTRITITRSTNTPKSRFLRDRRGHGWLGDQKRRESKRAERINNELQTAYAE
jgi:hypothetical protein